MPVKFITPRIESPVKESLKDGLVEIRSNRPASENHRLPSSPRTIVAAPP